MKIYINVAITGSVNNFLQNLLSNIKDSCLYEACDTLYLILNGNTHELTTCITEPKMIQIQASNDISKCEFPALSLIHRHSLINDDNILYIHTKGVTRSATKPNDTKIIDWGNYLTYFNVNKWEDRLEELKLYDCTGCDLKGNPDDIYSHPSYWGHGKAPLHYSGNFWWYKYSHIRKLCNPIDWLPSNDYVKWRMMAEMWVCHNKEGKYHNAWDSNTNHYLDNYPPEKYR